MKFMRKLLFFVFLILYSSSNPINSDSRNPFLAPSEPDFEKVSDFVIKSIAHSNGKYAAIISSPTQSRILSVGDKVKNYTVRSITDALLILEKNEREHIIYFNESQTLK